MESLIVYERDCVRYYDKYGNELHEGDIIKFSEDNDAEMKLYRTKDGYLGTDATNPELIKSGRAYPCEYGVYTLEQLDMNEIVLVRRGNK